MWLIWQVEAKHAFFFMFQSGCLLMFFLGILGTMQMVYILSCFISQKCCARWKAFFSLCFSFFDHNHHYMILMGIIQHLKVWPTTWRGWLLVFWEQEQAFLGWFGYTWTFLWKKKWRAVFFFFLAGRTPQPPRVGKILYDHITKLNPS